MTLGKLSHYVLFLGSLAIFTATLCLQKCFGLPMTLEERRQLQSDLLPYMHSDSFLNATGVRFNLLTPIPFTEILGHHFQINLTSFLGINACLAMETALNDYLIHRHIDESDRVALCTINRDLIKARSQSVPVPFYVAERLFYHANAVPIRRIKRVIEPESNDVILLDRLSRYDQRRGQNAIIVLWE